MRICKDIKNGYLYIYNPTHPMADKGGKLYVHRLVMSEKLGRLLESNEIVHHIDSNKENNHPANLELTNRSEHARQHMPTLENRYCEYCKKEYKPKKSKQKYCSHLCNNKRRRKFSISKELLEVYVWMYPTIKVAEMLNVSDTAIKKRCKKLGIEKPPRGYWAKKSPYSSTGLEQHPSKM